MPEQLIIDVKKFTYLNLHLTLLYIFYVSYLLPVYTCGRFFLDLEVIYVCCNRSTSALRNTVGEMADHRGGGGGSVVAEHRGGGGLAEQSVVVTTLENTHAFIMSDCRCFIFCVLK